MAYELRTLNVNNGRAEYTMLQMIECEEYGFTNEVNGMSYEEYKGWLLKEDDISNGRNLPEGWIPQTTYFLYVEGIPVGIARIRNYSSACLERQGVGNFGYGIAKPYRGMGYGNILFQQIRIECKCLGYVKIRSFVHIENIQSNQIFIKNGAMLIGVFDGIKNIYETWI